MKCKINGIEYRAESDFYISEQSGNKTSSEINVIIDDPATQPVPLSGDIVTLKSDDDTPLFWGTCGIPKSPKYCTGLEDQIYTLTCGNANQILSNRIINVAYQSTAISAIVADLFTQYIAEEGVTLGTISNITLALDVYTAKDYNLQDALNELADLVGATWQISASRVFSFVVYADFPTFPHTISQSYLLGSDWQSTTKDYKTRTVQYISGAMDTTSTQTESFTYADKQKTFIVGFGVASKPTITVNGTAVDPNIIGVNGLNDSSTFYFSYNSPNISYDTDTAYLAVGDTVAISYTGLFSIRISASNDAKIAQIAAATGTSGKREMVQIGTGITSYSDALTTANQLLQQFAEVQGEVSFWLFSYQLAALGMQLSDTNIYTRMTFDLPQINIFGDYVIVERKLEPLSAADDNFETGLKISLRLVDRDYVKSYGETISSLRSDISKLSIRDDDIIIQGGNIGDTETLSEASEYAPDIAYFPTDGTIDGSIFAPLAVDTSIYPMGGAIII